MGTYSVWHWIILIVIVVGVLVPFWRLLPRAGIPAPVALLTVVPGVALVLLWIIQALAD